MRFKYLFVVAILLNVSCKIMGQKKKDVNRDKPNLLFIITDQQRFDALSIAGNSVLKTPNLDRLASEGAYFKNAYTPMAVCAPARASIFTGMTVEHTGVNTNGIADEGKKESGVMPQQTFDEILATNGYHVEYYGKYHSPEFHNHVYQNPKRYTKSGESVFGQGMRQHYIEYLAENVPIKPLAPGDFIDDYSGRSYTPNPLDKRFNTTKNDKKAFIQPDFHGRLNIPEEYSITAMHAKETLEAIERLKDQPFSITCSFHFPHAPMLPSGKYYQMYDPNKVQIPASIADDMSNSPYKNSNGRMGNKEYADPNKIKYMISDYYGLVTEVDDWVGKILNKLDELKLTDNTLVIFTSDHGEMLGAHGLREKNIFYEESSHIPLFIKFPGEIKSKTVVNNYVTNVDLFPTIMDYLNQPKKDVDGKSLRDLIEKKPSNRANYIVTEWNYRGDTEPNYMIVKDGWKMFIPQTATSKVIDVLYNLKEDPHEMNNLIGNNPDRKKYTAKVAELKTDLLQWLKDHHSEHYEGVKEREIIK
nr:sulfatase-like hydrolase/transferase [uncultured Pedobacter sp.]